MAAARDQPSAPPLALVWLSSGRAQRIGAKPRPTMPHKYPLGPAGTVDAMLVRGPLGGRASIRMNEETWTHGSAEQRQEWFATGLEAGSADACDTFEADI
jgi:putative neutral zinc metallopeptidase